MQSQREGITGAFLGYRQAVHLLGASHSQIEKSICDDISFELSSNLKFSLKLS